MEASPVAQGPPHEKAPLVRAAALCTVGIVKVINPLPKVIEAAGGAHNGRAGFDSWFTALFLQCPGCPLRQESL